MWPFSRRIFLSYSSVDRPIVDSVSRLFDVAGALAYCAPADLSYGEPWWPQIMKAIRRSRKVLVFWCHHSSTSQWVEKEWRYAVEQHKLVVPVLLDNTSVPSELKRFHALNLRLSALHKYRREDGGLNTAKFISDAPPGIQPVLARVESASFTGFGAVFVVLALVRPFDAPSGMTDQTAFLVNVSTLILGFLLTLPASPLLPYMLRKWQIRREPQAQELLQQLVVQFPDHESAEHDT